MVQGLNILGVFKYRCIVLQHLRPFVSGGRSLIPRVMRRSSFGYKLALGEVLIFCSKVYLQVSFVTGFVCMCSWGKNLPLPLRIVYLRELCVTCLA